MNGRRGWPELVVLIATLTCAAIATAADPYVPAILEPWRGWVLDRHPDLGCPPRYDNATIRPCVWMSAITLDLARGGGRFAVDVDVFADADVTLPGGGDQWPDNVRSASGPAIVTRLDDRPRTHLAPGRYNLSGAFGWAELPDSIALPRQHGMLRLTIDGAPIGEPLIDGDKLWLGRGPDTGSAVPNDALTVRVYRRLDDGVPMLLDTYLDLSVAGSHRIVSLGRALPEGFRVTGLDSDLPARVEPDGDLKVQIEPGEWHVHLAARALGMPTSFRAAPSTVGWPAEEIWGFNADRSLRVVGVEGATPIDLSQTNAPFKDVPAFVVTATNELKLVEQIRGDPNPSPNEFALARSVWLSFDGDSFTVQDTLDGTVPCPTRLAARFVPGRITVDDAPQLITQIGDAQPGIELRSGVHKIVATSELPRGGLDTAVGWQTDVARLTGELHLPPGWRLLWTHGVDRAPTAWLSSWTLWDIFVVAIAAVLALRLIGGAAAALVIVTLVVVYQEPGAPTFAWILLLLLLAVLRVGRGRFGQFARLSYFVVLMATLLAVLSFAIDGFRMAIYPQLEGPGVASVIGSRADVVLPASEPTEEFGRLSQGMESTTLSAERKPAPARPRHYEANSQVQTGPGVPSWRWHDETLIWDGPVTAAQPLALALSPPWLTRTLHVIGPTLLLLLTALLATVVTPPSIPLPSWLKRMAGSAPVGLLLVAVGMTMPPHARADIPSAQLLGELERRLTQPPDCLPACAAVNRATVKLIADSLTLRLEINAAARVALPLPATQWWPADARDGDRPAVITRDDAGALAVAVAQGVHSIELTGSVAHVDRFELPFPMPPGALSLELKGWKAHGEQDGHLRGGALQFEREAKALTDRTAASLAADPIAPYFRLSRSIDFGLEWRIHTQLTRLAPQSGGIPFAVPLVSGESLLDGRVRVDGGLITGTLPPDQQAIGWESALATTQTLELTAAPITDWSEQWTLIPSNFWHVDYTGLPASLPASLAASLPTNPPAGPSVGPSANLAPMKLKPDEAAGPRFAPLGGETLRISITRPIPVAGETITAERVDLSEQPGARARRTTLSLDLLSSQGGNYTIRVPDDAKILAIAINAAPQPTPTSGTALALPVVPGRQHAEIVWEAPRAVSTTIHTSAVEVPGRAYNVGLHIALPTDRWPLFVGGPRLGPAVLYWGVLFVVIGAAFALSRIPALPMTTIDSILLGFGMSLCNLPSTLLVAAWLLILLARQRAVARIREASNLSFKLMQTLIALMSIAALIALAASIPLGLLGTPQMQITGNGSTAYEYHWFQDQAQSVLPDAFVVSLPMWAYRVVMLAWSLWLAFALVRWARWGWTAFCAGGIWNRPGRAGELAASPG